MLGDTAKMVVDEYGGDLRRLREAAGGDPAELRRRLKAFKGIGEVGADIFLREVQAAWREVLPFADKRALAAARQLDLPDDAGGLADLVSEDDFPRLVAGFVRCDLAGDHDDVKGGRRP